MFETNEVPKDIIITVAARDNVSSGSVLSCCDGRTR